MKIQYALLTFLLPAFPGTEGQSPWTVEPTTVNRFRSLFYWSKPAVVVHGLVSLIATQLLNFSHSKTHCSLSDVQAGRYLLLHVALTQQDHDAPKVRGKTRSSHYVRNSLRVRELRLVLLRAPERNTLSLTD